MNVGILGAGFMGGVHARAYTRLPDVRVAVVASRSEEKAARLAQEVGAVAVTDYRSVIEDPAIEAINITLPTHLHCEYAVAALRAGKHVLLEKPFGLTTEDCDAVMRARPEDGILMVAHVLRFWPEYVTLVELVQSGVLGKPLSAVATRRSSPPEWADWYRDPVLSGGAVLDLIVHDLDLLNGLFGGPRSVYARGHEAAPGLWNDIHAVIDYGLAEGVVDGSQLMPRGFPFSCGLQVLCEHGGAEFVFRAGGASVEQPGESRLMVYEDGRAYVPVVPPGDAYERQVASFVECVRQRRQPVHGSPEQARLAVLLAGAVRRSLETGEISHLPEL
ncbi:MAG: Gfo/Idh/MocA family oxidoreductase [Anaerolineae bacterium]|nr:Gfo/Idh/MocA family oxidoreductase [Anaerolineae bacterium]